MKKLLVLMMLVAVQGHTSFNGYGVATVGVMLHQSSESFIGLDKFAGGFGGEFVPVSFFALGAEFGYSRGVSTDPRPMPLEESHPRWMYGGFSDRGVSFVKVQYFELWLRPKLLVPIPFISPYLVLPVSPLSYGGMQGYSVFGVGFGALAGLQVSLGSVWLFAESGLLVRSRKGTNTMSDGPPWGMFDATVPISAGLGFKL